MSFFDRADKDFLTMRKVLDGLMKKKAREGVAKTKQARSVTLQEEETLWNSGVFDTSTPQGLFNSLFYYVGMRFALRGGSELYGLQINQFRLEMKDGIERLIYSENASKTNNGGLRDRRYVPKQVEALCDFDIGDRCVVKLFKLYMTKRDCSLPSMWLKPLVNPRDGAKWFGNQRVGIHTCQKKIKEFGQAIGSTGITNHSMRRTAVTRLVKAGFDDQTVRSVTGHRSSALEAYKERDDSQVAEIGRALASGQRTTLVNNTEANISVSAAPSMNITMHNCTVYLSK